MSFQDGIHRLYGKARITFCTDGRRTVLVAGRCGLCGAEVTTR